MIGAWMLAVWMAGLGASPAPAPGSEPRAAEGVSGRLGLVTRGGEGCHLLQFVGPAPEPGAAVTVVRLAASRPVAASSWRRSSSRIRGTPTRAP